MSMIMEFYYNVYYRFYCLVRYFGEEETPRYNAALLMSVFSMLNVMIVIFGTIILSRRIIIIDLPKIYLLILGMLITGTNCYMIFGGKRYLIVEKKYQNEDKRTRIKNNLYAVLYAVLTVLFFVLELVYLNYHPIKV